MNKQPFLNDDNFFKNTEMDEGGNLIKSKKGRCGGNPIGAQGGPQDGTGPGGNREKMEKLGSKEAVEEEKEFEISDEAHKLAHKVLKNEMKLNDALKEIRKEEKSGFMKYIREYGGKK